MKTLCMLLFINFALLSASVSAQEELCLASGEWAPYTSQRMIGHGVVTEIVTAIVHEMGMKPKYIFSTWQRGEQLVLDGCAFGVFPYVQTEERLKSFQFTDGFFIGGDYHLFYNTSKFENAPQWKSMEDLNAYQMGIVAGEWTQEYFENAGMSPKILLKKYEQAFKMLYEKRIDVVLAEEHIGWWYARKLFPHDYKSFGVTEKPFAKAKRPGGMMISSSYPDSEQLLIRFNNAFQRIRDNGVYQAIIDRYGIKNLPLE